jgi:hypothetical protein
MRSEITVAAVLFFLVLFLLWMAVKMWITKPYSGLKNILLARPCEKIGQAAEVVAHKGHKEARFGDAPRRLSTWPPGKPDTVSTWFTYSGLRATPALGLYRPLGPIKKKKFLYVVHALACGHA